LRDACNTMEENYTFPLRDFRELVLDISVPRMVALLNKVGGDTTGDLLTLWEENKCSPDWRNRIAINRLYVRAKAIYLEKRAKHKIEAVERLERGITSGIFNRNN